MESDGQLDAAAVLFAGRRKIPELFGGGAAATAPDDTPATQGQLGHGRPTRWTRRAARGVGVGVGGGGGGDVGVGGCLAAGGGEDGDYM